MLKYIFLLAFVFLCMVSKSQQRAAQSSPPKPLTLHQEQIEDRNHNCLHRNKYSLAERLQMFPFADAASIKIVSFAIKIDSNDPDKKIKNFLPIKNDTVCYNELKESADLTVSQVDTLTDILYNVGFRGPTRIGSISLCFHPRNAIIFFDKQGKLLTYIEICFECQWYHVSSEQIMLGDICKQKYALIKKFFISAGVKYGTLTHTHDFE